MSAGEEAPSTADYAELELMIRGYQFASVVPVKVCARCGAIVGNLPAHDEWHARVGR